MTTCDERRATLRRGEISGLDDETRRHLQSCRGCAEVWRAGALLAYGSGAGDETALRPGFAGRVRAALEARAGSAAPVAWTDAVGRLLAPSLAAASVLAMLAAGFYVALAGSGDLSQAVESDPILGSVVAGHGGVLFASPDERPDFEWRP